MNEFSLIHQYFHAIQYPRDDVLFGIGDDAAGVHVPEDMDLLIGMDTLVDGVHFLANWDAYDIAWRSVQVNVSDMAAMAATPCWATLALTLPSLDESFLQRFSQGLRDALHQHHISLIGGDTTRGPLSVTLTIHGLAPKGKAVRRNGAQPMDYILVSGPLGGAACAVSMLHSAIPVASGETYDALMEKLLHPTPRLDLIETLRDHATSAIDISDGLSADLNHILQASHVGACLGLNTIPVHPVVQQLYPDQSIDFALTGGDDYELCFTVSPESYSFLMNEELGVYCIGRIESELGLRALSESGKAMPIHPRGYSHF